MPAITPGNSLYLYSLLSQRIGVGKQTMIANVEETLADDDIWPQDMGCSDVRELLDKLDFVRLTVFKRGRVYATILARPEWDALLERTKSTDKKATGGGPKSWKKKKGGKDLRPERPRPHGRPKPSVAKDAGAAAEASAEAKPAPEAEQEAAAAHDASTAEANKVPEAAPVPAPAEEAAPAAEATPAPEAGAEAEPETKPDAEAAPTAEAKPEPAPTSEGLSAPEPEPESEPVPEPKPADKPQAEATPESVAAPEPASPRVPTRAPKPAPAAAPAAPRQRRRVAAPPVERPIQASASQPLVPQEFANEVWCPSSLLSTLYQLLPLDVSPIGLLSEDWRVARSTEAYAVTPGGVSFELRCLKTPDAQPMRATLRRRAATASGRRWELSAIDGPLGDAFVDFDGVPAADEGAWSDLTGLPKGTYYRTTPLREFTQFATLGPWQTLLSQLAAIAQREDWGDGFIYLREHLVVTYHRLVFEHKVVTSGDGLHASFDTGLLTPDSRRIFANFSAQSGSVPWRLAGFSTLSVVTPAPEPVAYVTELRHLMLAAPYTVSMRPTLERLYGSGLGEAIERSVTCARRNHRAATPAYDPQSEEMRLLLPLAIDAPGMCDHALVLAPLDEGGYEARAVTSLERARTCARVVTSDLPTWLA